jgi:hypothetical protein
MGKSNVKIADYVIDDAELFIQKNTSQEKIAIPCYSDPELCMQLDGWDELTSIPALVDGKHSLLYKENYDSLHDQWIMRME